LVVADEPRPRSRLDGIVEEDAEVEGEEGVEGSSTGLRTPSDRQNSTSKEDGAAGDTSGDKRWVNTQTRVVAKNSVTKIAVMAEEIWGISL
jgi:hypothetical protein